MMHGGDAEAHALTGRRRSLRPDALGGTMANVAIEPLNPPSLPEAKGTYTHGTLVVGAQRTVYVSGQPPWVKDGTMPTDFASQCRLVWQNVLAVLAEAGMGAGNLAKVTTFLSDRQYRSVNGAIRKEFLGEHRPALTVIIADIYEEEWLLEIEAIAVA
jgi:enamine deaminase RidA (YjgF/YER057c/UK114 family)